MIKRSGAQWQALFAEQAQSGLSAAAFCKERKLCPKYFSLRRKQLSGEGRETPKQKAFIQAKPESAVVPAIRLHYRHMELQFDQASPEFLIALMTMLP